MQVAAQARPMAAQIGNANSLAYGMDSVQPAARSTASVPQAYGGGAPIGKGCSTQSLYLLQI